MADNIRHQQDNSLLQLSQTGGAQLPLPLDKAKLALLPLSLRIKTLLVAIDNYDKESTVMKQLLMDCFQEKHRLDENIREKITQLEAELLVVNAENTTLSKQLRLANSQHPLLPSMQTVQNFVAQVLPSSQPVPVMPIPAFVTQIKSSSSLTQNSNVSLRYKAIPPKCHTSSLQHMMDNYLSTGFIYVDYKRAAVGHSKATLLMQLQQLKYPFPTFTNDHEPVGGTSNVLVTGQFPSELSFLPRYITLAPTRMIGENTISSLWQLQLVESSNFTPVLHGQTSKEDHYTAHRRKDQTRHLRKYEREFDRINQESKRETRTSISIEAHAFQTFMSDHGYISHLMTKVPHHLIHRALQHYVNGLGLLHLGKIFRLNEQHKKLFGENMTAEKLHAPNVSPLSGKKQRKIILKVWRDYIAKEHGVSLQQPFFGQSGETDAEFEKRIKDMDWSSKTAARTVRDSLKANQGTLDNMAQSFVGTVTDSIKNQFTGVMSNVTISIEKQFGVSPKAVKWGLIVLIVCCIMLTVFSVSTFLLVARAVFAAQGLIAEHTVTGQGHEDDEDVKSFLAETMSSVVSKATGTNVSGFVTSVNSTSRFLGSLNTIAGFIKTCCEYLSKLIDWCYEKMTGVPFFSSTVSAHNIMQAYEEFYSRCMTLDLNEMANNRQKCKEFCQAYLRLQREYLEIHKTSIDKVVATRMQTILLHGYRLMVEVSARLGNCHGRQQPVWTALYGPPGQGKTVLTKGLISGLAYMLNKDVQPHNVFYRNPHEEFWSGYDEMKFAVVMDDLFQETDPQIRSRVANELILMRNVCGFPLNMASLSDKGTTMFVSPLIITSSNCQMTALKNIGISDPRALYRRQDFTVYVALKPTTNTNEPIAELTPENCDNYHLVLTHEQGVPVLNPNATATMGSRQIPGIIITYADLVARMHVSYCKAEASHKKTFSRINWGRTFKKPPGGSNPPPPPSQGGGGGGQGPNNNDKSNSSMTEVVEEEDFNYLNPFLDYTHVEKYEQVQKPLVEVKEQQSIGTSVKDFFNPIANFFGKDDIIKKKQKEEAIVAKEGAVFQQKVVQATADMAHFGMVPPGQSITVTVTTNTNTTSSTQTTTTTPSDEFFTTMHNASLTGQGFLDPIKKGFNTFTQIVGTTYQTLALGAKMCKPTCSNHLPKATQEMWQFFHQYWLASQVLSSNSSKQLCHHSIMSLYHHSPPTNMSKWVRYFYRHPENCKNLTVYFRGKKAIDVTADEIRNDSTMLDGFVIAKESCTFFRPENFSAAQKVCGNASLTELSYGFAPVGCGPKTCEELSRLMYKVEGLVKTPEMWCELIQKPTLYEVAEEMQRMFNHLDNQDGEDIRIRFEMLKGKWLTEIVQMKGIIDARNLGIKILCGYAAIILIVSTLSILARSLGFNSDQGFFGGQSEDKNHKKQMEKLMKNRYKAPTVQTVPSHKQPITGQTDDNADAVATRIFEKNLIYVHFINDLDESQDFFSWVLMLGGSVGAMACHGYDRHHPTSAEVFYDPLRETCVSWRIKEVKRIPDRDLVLLKFSASTCFKDLTKHLPSIYRSDPIHNIVRLGVDKNARVKSEAPVAYPLAEKKYDQVSHVKQMHAVEMSNSKGDCGKPYLIYNTQYDKKILGIHVAGDGLLFSLVAPIYVSDLDGFLDRQNMIVEADTMTGQNFDLAFKFEQGASHPNSNMKYVGTFEKKPPQPFHTQIIPTPIKTGLVMPDGKCVSPPFPITQAPAMLRKTTTSKGVIDPHILAYRSLDNHKLIKPPPELDKKEVYDGCFSPVIYRHVKRRLTIEEAIFGCPAINMPSIDLTTSPGFPWCLKGIRRKDLINTETKWIHPQLRKEVEFIVVCARAGIVVPHITVHCLKDETRPLDKVEAGHTRAFQIGSLQHLIFHRMILAFYVFQTEHDKNTDIAVGMNVYSLDWDRLHARLTQVCKKWIESDCKAYDLTFPSYFAWYMAPIVVERYGITDPEWINEIHVVFIQTVCGYVLLPDGMLVILDRMKSGTFLTSFLNSLFNSTKGRTIYMRLARLAGIPLAFKQSAEQTKFGDDDLAAIIEKFLEWYNGQTIAKAAKDMYNQTHTSATKSEILPLYTPSEEAQYLSRTFVPMENFIVAKLSRESIHSMVQFVRKSEVPMAVQMKINIENALRELVYYGEDEYNHYQNIFNHFLRHCHQAPVSTTFSQNKEIMMAFKQQ